MVEWDRDDEREATADGRTSLKQDDLVGKLVPDPSRVPPDVQVLSGFVGESAQVGHWRLYLTLQMDEYYEFAEAAIVHTHPLTPDQSPLGGSIVWLKSDAEVRHTRVVTRRVQAEFVQGGLWSAASARSSMAVMAGPGGVDVPPVSPGAVCTLATNCQKSQIPSDCPKESKQPGIALFAPGGGGGGGGTCPVSNPPNTCPNSVPADTCLPPKL